MQIGINNKTFLHISKDQCEGCMANATQHQYKGTLHNAFSMSSNIQLQNIP